jgi:ribosomal protein L25 (general stress protein Ctc)
MSKAALFEPTDIIDLDAQERDTTLTMHQLRTAGFTPATVYGPKTNPSLSIQVPTAEFVRLYHGRHAKQFKLTGVNGAPVVKIQQLQLKNIGDDQIVSIEFFKAD